MKPAKLLDAIPIRYVIVANDLALRQQSSAVFVYDDDFALVAAVILVGQGVG